MDNPYYDLKEHEGEVLTYRQLCDLIGEELKRGKGKELHLSKLRQYLDLDTATVPRKIVLREVYTPDDFKIISKRGKFLPFIRNILLRRMQVNLNRKPPVKSLSGTYWELMQEIGLIDKAYRENRYSGENVKISIKEKYTDTVDAELIAEDSKYQFLSITDQILKEILRSSLRQMEKQELIQIRYNVRLFNIVTYTDEEEEEQTRIESYALNEKEYAAYQQIGKEVVEEFSLSGLQELFYKGKTDPNVQYANAVYTERVQAFIKEQGYSRAAKVFILSLQPKGMQYMVDRRFIDAKMLRANIKEKIIQENVLQKVIPAPILEELISMYL